MRYAILIVLLVLVLGVVGLVGLFSGIGDALRRRRGADRDTAVIADSETEFEQDVGRPPPGP